MTIKHITLGGLDALSMEAGGYEAVIIPSVGANLVRLFHAETEVSILRTPTSDEIETFLSRPQIFGLPLLFPPNRIEDGTYTFEGRVYRYPITIPAENNYHHGIIKSQPFTVTNTRVASDYVEVELSHFSNAFNNAIYQDFPHEFVCRLTFRLSAQGLKQTTSVTNLSSLNMPLGVGYHTPINVPFTPDGNPEDYTIRMSVSDAWELNERTLPTGARAGLGDLAALPHEGIRPTGTAIERALTNAPMVVDGRSYNGAVIEDTKKKLRVCYEVSPEYRFWTLWNNGGTVSYVCPEPQTWIHNAPNLALPADQTGFRSLAPGKTWSAEKKLYVLS